MLRTLGPGLLKQLRTIPGSATFICPADSPPEDWPAPNSYRGNWGVGPGWAQNPLFPDSANWFFVSANFISIYPVRAAQIYDGSSRTAMFTERLFGSGTPDNFDPLRDIRRCRPEYLFQQRFRHTCGL